MEDRIARAIAELHRCGIPITLTFQLGEGDSPKMKAEQASPVETPVQDEKEEPIEEGDAWLSVKEAKKVLNTSDSTLRRHANEGKIKRKYVGPHPKYLRSSLLNIK